MQNFNWFRCATAGADPKFVATTFAEYVADKQQSYNTLLSLCGTALDGSITTRQQAIELIQQADSTWNSECWVQLSSGSIRIADLLLALSQQAALVADNLSATEFDEVIELTRLDGSSVSVSIAAIGDDLQTQLHSVTTLAGAAKAMIHESLTERLTYFRDYITRTFSNGYADLSNSLSYYTDLLEQCNTPESFIASIRNAMEVDELASDDSQKELEDTNIYDYTGASPMGALDFSSAVAAAGSVIRTGAKVVKNVITGVLGLGAKLFSWIGGKIYNVAINPYDLEIIDDNASSYTIDGWQYQTSGTIQIQSTNNMGITKKDIDAIDLSKPVQMQTLAGECIFTGMSRQGNYAIGGTWMFKPRPINPMVITAVLSEYQSVLHSGISVTELQQMFYRLSQSPGIYLDTDANERDMIIGFKCAYFLQLAINWAARFEMDNANETTPDPRATFEAFPNYWNAFKQILDEILIQNQGSGVPSTVTNADFIKIASGWNGSTFPSLTTYVPYATGIREGYEYLYQSNALWSFLLNAWIANRVQRSYFPVDYNFVPYTTHNVGFQKARFRVKTDAENQNAFNTFLTVAIIVVVVATVAITALVKLKKAANLANFNAAGKQRQIENALANGQPVSKADYKAWRKAKRKANLLSGFSSQTQSATVSAISRNANEYDTVLAAITG